MTNPKEWAVPSGEQTIQVVSQSGEKLTPPVTLQAGDSAKLVIRGSKVKIETDKANPKDYQQILAWLRETHGQEYTAERLTQLIDQACRERAIEELEQLITNINIAEGYKPEPNKELKWPNGLILDRITELRGQGKLSTPLEKEARDV